MPAEIRALSEICRLCSEHILLRSQSRTDRHRICRGSGAAAGDGRRHTAASVRHRCWTDRVLSILNAAQFQLVAQRNEIFLSLLRQEFVDLSGCKPYIGPLRAGVVGNRDRFRIVVFLPEIRGVLFAD